MKTDFWKSWKFWAAVVAVLLVITCIILWFTNPTFCIGASGFTIGALIGFITGYVICKKYC